MSFNINPTAYADVFSFPKEVVNKHLKLAGAAQLKVLLWLFSQGVKGANSSEISKAVGLSESDVNDAMQYWVINGLVIDSDANKINSKSEKPCNEEKEEPKRIVKHVSSRSAQKISRYEIVKRSSESPEISWLLTEAQTKFGRTLSNAEMTTLVWLFDTEGLPVEVILMIIEHSASIGKCNLRYIESTAISWINNQIDTVEKAEKHLIELDRRKQEWHKISSAFGLDRAIPSAREQEYVVKWLREWKFSMKMIREAYNRCIDNTSKLSFAYINKILLAWHNKGFSKPEDIKDDEIKTSKKENKNKLVINKSYDMDDIKKLFSSNEEG